MPVFLLLLVPFLINNERVRKLLYRLKNKVFVHKRPPHGSTSTAAVGGATLQSPPSINEDDADSDCDASFDHVIAYRDGFRNIEVFSAKHMTLLILSLLGAYAFAVWVVAGVAAPDVHRTVSYSIQRCVEDIGYPATGDNIAATGDNIAAAALNEPDTNNGIAKGHRKLYEATDGPAQLMHTTTTEKLLDTTATRKALIDSAAVPYNAPQLCSNITTDDITIGSPYKVLSEHSAKDESGVAGSSLEQQLAGNRHLFEAEDEETAGNAAGAAAGTGSGAAAGAGGGAAAGGATGGGADIAPPPLNTGAGIDLKGSADICYWSNAVPAWTLNLQFGRRFEQFFALSVLFNPSAKHKTDHKLRALPTHETAGNLTCDATGTTTGTNSAPRVAAGDEQSSARMRALHQRPVINGIGKMLGHLRRHRARRSAYIIDEVQYVVGITDVPIHKVPVHKDGTVDMSAFGGSSFTDNRVLVCTHKECSPLRILIFNRSLGQPSMIKLSLQFLNMTQIADLSRDVSIELTLRNERFMAFDAALRSFYFAMSIILFAAGVRRLTSWPLSTWQLDQLLILFLVLLSVGFNDPLFIGAFVGISPIITTCVFLSRTVFLALLFVCFAVVVDIVLTWKELHPRTTLSSRMAKGLFALNIYAAAVVVFFSRGGTSTQIPYVSAFDSRPNYHLIFSELWLILSFAVFILWLCYVTLLRLKTLKSLPTNFVILYAFNAVAALALSVTVSRDNEQFTPKTLASDHSVITLYLLAVVVCLLPPRRSLDITKFQHRYAGQYDIDDGTESLPVEDSSDEY